MNKQHTCKRGSSRCLGINDARKCTEDQLYIHISGYRKQRDIIRNILAVKHAFKLSFKTVRIVNEWYWLRECLNKTSFSHLFPSIRNIRNFYLHHPVLTFFKDMFKIEYLTLRQRVASSWIAYLKELPSGY
jgi:hypothetical protein